MPSVLSFEGKWVLVLMGWIEEICKGQLLFHWGNAGFEYIFIVNKMKLFVYLGYM